MARQKGDGEIRRSIKWAQGLIEEVSKIDGNEAETRARVEQIFRTVMGYDFGHLSHEYAIRGSGLTEHADLAIQLEKGPDAKPVAMVELKRVNVDLAPKHLRQVSSYAINLGCEWVLLTNAREWRIYHVEYGQPPVTKLVDHWNLVKDDVRVLGKKFEVLSFKNLRRGSLDKLWKRAKVLSPQSILGAFLSPECLKQARRILRKKADVIVGLEDIVGGFKRLLNENAAKTLDDLKLQVAPKRAGTRRAASEPHAAEKTSSEQAGEVKCSICGVLCKSPAGLKVHVGRQHKSQAKGEPSVESPSLTQVPPPTPSAHDRHTPIDQA